MAKRNQSSRRSFLKASTLAVAGAAMLPGVAHAAGSDSIKVGLIGCGGRGSGAAENVLESAKGVQIVAFGDFTQNKAKGLRGNLINFVKQGIAKEYQNEITAAEKDCHGGLDAYEKVIATPGLNYVMLATPPGFRPLHIQAAVAAGKNLFTEKPVGVDGTGIRKVLDAYDAAKKKGLGVAAGTQRRHQSPYIETIKQIHGGAIGDILSARCYWNQGDIWFRDRQQGMTDLEYQIHNWYHFCWLCGDHINEQHVHNLDVVNWAIGKPPIRALGMGGRTRAYSDPNKDGHIYNFFSVEYEYPGGIHVHSQCRQVNNSDGNLPGLGGVSEAIVGTKGTCQVDRYTINGKRVLSPNETRKSTNPYVQEHTDLIESIRAGKPINELKNVAESTLTAIMGRMSAYTGKVVSWDQALRSKLDLMPAKLTLDMSLQADPLPVPGKTPLI